MRNKLVTWLLLAVCLMLFVNLVRSWFYLEKRGNIIKETQDKYKKENELHETLVRKLAGVESQEYIEEQARDKLNVGREGEIVVILPTISPIVESTPIPIDNSSNLEKWLKVFF